MPAKVIGLPSWLRAAGADLRLVRHITEACGFQVRPLAADHCLRSASRTHPHDCASGSSPRYSGIQLAWRMREGARLLTPPEAITGHTRMTAGTELQLYVRGFWQAYPTTLTRSTPQCGVAATVLAHQPAHPPSTQPVGLPPLLLPRPSPDVYTRSQRRRARAMRPAEMMAPESHRGVQWIFFLLCGYARSACRAAHLPRIAPFFCLTSVDSLMAPATLPGRSAPGIPRPSSRPRRSSAFAAGARTPSGFRLHHQISGPGLIPAGGDISGP